MRNTALIPQSLVVNGAGTARFAVLLWIPLSLPSVTESYIGGPIWTMIGIPVTSMFVMGHVP
jgi:hypothetical protein